MNLKKLGWNSYFEALFADINNNDGLIPMRIIMPHSNGYLGLGENTELSLFSSGRLKHEAKSRSDLPVVGDWVAVRPRIGEGTGAIQAILARKTQFSRKVPGKASREQVLVANVDTVFIVTGLDLDYNLQRLERYLTLAWDSGANPIIILNKADLCDDLDEKLEAVESIAFGIPVHAISATQNTGVAELQKYFVEGQTVALLGSSGVGKSSLINQLLGEERQRVVEVREDDSHGRHTTTHRELFFLPNDGMIIDNPGMRELQMLTNLGGLQETFDDIERLAENCRFRDCQHQTEPGCAVLAALESGELEKRRYQNYLKLHKEIEFQTRRHDVFAQLEEKNKWKKIGMLTKDLYKNNQKYK